MDDMTIDNEETTYLLHLPKRLKRELEQIAEEEHRALKGQINSILENYVKERKNGEESVG